MAWTNLTVQLDREVTRRESSSCHTGQLSNLTGSPGAQGLVERDDYSREHLTATLGLNRRPPSVAGSI